MPTCLGDYSYIIIRTRPDNRLVPMPIPLRKYLVLPGLPKPSAIFAVLAIFAIRHCANPPLRPCTISYLSYLLLLVSGPRSSSFLQSDRSHSAISCDVSLPGSTTHHCVYCKYGQSSPSRHGFVLITRIPRWSFPSQPSSSIQIAVALFRVTPTWTNHLSSRVIWLDNLSTRAV